MNSNGKDLNKFFILLGVITLVFLIDHNIGVQPDLKYDLFGFELTHGEMNVFLICLSLSLLYPGLKSLKK